MTTNPEPSDRTALSFDDDVGASRSRWIAGAIILALVGWMSSGFVLPTPESEPSVAVADVPREVLVAVRLSQAEPVTQFFSAEGQAQPERLSAIRSEATGEVDELAASRGEVVEAGEVIARLDVAEREADLERARAELARAEREAENAQALLERGVATVDRIAETRSALAAARAQLAAAEQAIENTVIRAPFPGTLEALTIELGEFVTSSEQVGQIIDATPLTVAIQIPQQSLAEIEVGQIAQVDFITGQQRQGEVVFVGTFAEAETRTFRAEVEIPNATDPVPAGVSAEVSIPTGQVVAHFLSPAILSLGPDGALGVKTVGEDDHVVFHEVEIVRAQSDGVWVSGLPEEARIITVGQGFVSAGERVDPQPVDDGPRQAAVAEPDR